MKLATKFLALLIVVLAAGVIPVEAAEIRVEKTYGQSVRGTVDGFPYLVLRGNASERGRAYGMLAGSEIMSSLNSMASFVSNQGISWQQIISGTSRYSYSSRYIQEMEAILQAINETLSESQRRVAAVNRAVNLDDLKAMQTADIFEEMRCSQFMAWGSLTESGEVVAGRNWDYPTIFPIKNSAIIAVDPSESGLKATMDANYFGLVGAGMVPMNEDGAYLSANSGGSSGGVRVSNPKPGTMVMRDAIESMGKTDAVEKMTEALQGKVGLKLIFTVAFPVNTAGGKLPAVLEYAPRSATTFSINTRYPTNPSNALVATNHFINESTGGDSTSRYNSLMGDINSGRKITFEVARSMMDKVARSNTLYTGVVWPAERRMMVAVAPSAGTAATKGRYVDVRWNEIFGSGGGSPTPGVLKPGDGNGDGKVNGLDYLYWLARFGNSGSPNVPLEGDYNGNKVVDGLDYLVWLNNFEE